jgi:hypothetical protein
MSRQVFACGVEESLQGTTAQQKSIRTVLMVSSFSANLKLDFELVEMWHVCRGSHGKTQL